jgi:YidC/Oxa1 family membrane protein insertase
VAALDPLNVVVAWIIMHLHAGLGDLFGPDTGLAWGLSIVILVALIRLCLVPLFIKQVHAQRKMAQHAPHLQELRKKYKNDKQRLNEETMKFYKENGVNPLAGCLPMIPQMIVFFALFNVLRTITDWKPGTGAPKYGLTVPVVESAQHATIFGVHLGDKLLFSHPTPPLHVCIVIALTVAVSASTTFMTVRQSAKRGLMQTNVDPDNPMAQSQKFMQYIVPFFSLTGLYWQYGLVLYWVTTNVWTLGQQYFMFRNWTTEETGAAGALAGATTGGTRAAQASLQAQTGARAAATRAPARAGSTKASPAAGTKNGTAAGAKTAAAANAKNGAAASAKNGTVSPAKTSPAKASSAKAATAGGAKTAANGGTRSGTQGSRPATDGTQTGSATRTAASPATQPATGQNGGEKRSLLRLGRKAEPEPEPEVPVAKVVRQQPTRQARSKRSGKR